LTVAARSKARKRALDVLFEAELRDLPVLGLLAERLSLGDRPTPEYAAEIVRGVSAHHDEIDGLIAGNAVGWTLERMPAVDRNILRMGIWELLWADDVPDGVAISEAVELAQDLSTDGSPAFVNGLLAKVARTGKRPGAPVAEPSDAGPVAEPPAPSAEAPASAGTAAPAPGTAAPAPGGRPAARRPARGLVKPPRIAVRPDPVDHPDAEEKSAEKADPTQE
jgi:transcription antitermination protein NusB